MQLVIGYFLVNVESVKFVQIKKLEQQCLEARDQSMALTY